MPRSASMLAFPRFAGTVKRLVLVNLAVYFALLLIGAANPGAGSLLSSLFSLIPAAVVHGYVWQLFTYSFVHLGVLEVLFNMLSLWFVGTYLEEVKGSRWLLEIYFLCVVGGGLIGTLLSFLHLPHLGPGDIVSGSRTGIFGLLVAFAVLFGDMEFLLFFTIGIKAKFLVAIYALIAIAGLFGGGSALPLVVYLSGGLLGFAYAKRARGRGLTFAVSEGYFSARNEYYRWKRRRAAKKFTVYMRKRNLDVPIDSEGKYVDPDERRSPNDRKWMN